MLTVPTLGDLQSNSISKIMSKFKIIVCHAHVQVLFTNHSQTHLVGASLFIIVLIYSVSSFTNSYLSVP